MILRIPKSEQNALLMECGLRGISVDFYTDERTEGLCFAEIGTENASIAYYLGQQVKQRVIEDQEEERLSDSLFDFFKIKMQ